MKNEFKPPISERGHEDLEESLERIAQRIKKSKAFIFIGAEDRGKEVAHHAVIGGSVFEIIQLHQTLLEALAEYLATAGATDTSGKPKH